MQQSTGSQRTQNVTWSICYRPALYINWPKVNYWLVVTHVDSSGGGRVFTGVCLSAYLQKSTQLGSPNITQKCSTMSPGKPSISGSNGQRSKSQGTKTVPWFLYSCECCLLLVLIVSRQEDQFQDKLWQIVTAFTAESSYILIVEFITKK